MKAPLKLGAGTALFILSATVVSALLHIAQPNVNTGPDRELLIALSRLGRLEFPGGLAVGLALLGPFVATCALIALSTMYQCRSWPPLVVAILVGFLLIARSLPDLPAAGRTRALVVFALCVISIGATELSMTTFGAETDFRNRPLSDVHLDWNAVLATVPEESVRSGPSYRRAIQPRSSP